jgi:hypothetical protein
VGEVLPQKCSERRCPARGRRTSRCGRRCCPKSPDSHEDCRSAPGDPLGTNDMGPRGGRPDIRANYRAAGPPGRAWAVPAASPKPTRPKLPDTRTAVANREIRFMAGSFRSAPPLLASPVKYLPRERLPIPTSTTPVGLVGTSSDQGARVNGVVDYPTFFAVRCPELRDQPPRPNPRSLLSPWLTRSLQSPWV